MSNFVKIGTVRLNLDNVTYVDEFVQRTHDPDTFEAIERSGVKAFFAFASTEYADDCVRFYGDEAKLLLAIIDQDDEAVDAIYERMYNARRVVLPPEEPAANFGTPASLVDAQPIDCDCPACEFERSHAGTIEAADEVDTSRGYPINFINLTNS